MPRQDEYPSGNPMLPGLRRVFDISSLGCRPRYLPDRRASTDNRTWQELPGRLLKHGYFIRGTPDQAGVTQAAVNRKRHVSRRLNRFGILSKIEKYARLIRVNKTTCGLMPGD